jgi:hypothetical protein
MSLQTDIIIVKALRADAELMKELKAGDVYNTSIEKPDAEMENIPVPYVIVTFDGMSEDSSTKDSSFAGDGDNVTVGIEVAADSRADVARLAIRIRKAVTEYLKGIDEDDEDYSLVPSSISLSAQGVQYDPVKPCFWQRLVYNCLTEID